MNQKVFVNILLIIVVVALVGAGVYVVSNRQNPPPVPSPTPMPSPSSTPASTPTPTPKPSPTPTPLPTTPRTGDIEEIQALLNKEQWVRVIVMLKGNEFTAPEFQDDAKKKAEVKKIQDAVLITLTEKDFQISHQYQYIITSFAGMISKSGMEKLLKNSQVILISLDRLSAPN